LGRSLLRSQREARLRYAHLFPGKKRLGSFCASLRRSGTIVHPQPLPLLPFPSSSSMSSAQARKAVGRKELDKLKRPSLSVEGLTALNASKHPNRLPSRELEVSSLSLPLPFGSRRSPSLHCTRTVSAKAVIRENKNRNDRLSFLYLSVLSLCISMTSCFSCFRCVRCLSEKGKGLEENA